MAQDAKSDQILATALEVFARFGFKKTTVDDVAAAAGMTKGNLYYYFENKRDLYEQTVGRALIRWRDAVAQAVEDSDDVVEKFVVMSRLSFEHLVTNPSLRAILIDDPSIFTLSAGEDRFRAINVGAMAIIRRILEQGIEEGRFYPVDVNLTTEFIFSAYVMFIIKSHIGSEESSNLQMYFEASRIILRGLCRQEHDREGA